MPNSSRNVSYYFEVKLKPGSPKDAQTPCWLRPRLRMDRGATFSRSLYIYINFCLSKKEVFRKQPVQMTDRTSPG